MRSGLDRGSHRRPVRSSGAAVCIWMPLILGLAEYRGDDGAGKGSRSVTYDIVEGDADPVFILLVFVDHEQCPVAVGPQHRISCHERMASPVANVAGCGIQAMLAIARLQPLQVDHAAREILREWLLDLEIVVGGEEAERSR